MPNRRRFRLFILPLLLMTAAWPASSAAQTDPGDDSGDDTGDKTPIASSAFRSEQRITAIDLVVAFDLDAFRNWALESPVPEKLVREDFEVLVGGQPRTLITVEPHDRWELVLWFDAVLMSTRDLRRSAMILSSQTAALAAMGTVEIVVADPEPKVTLRATSSKDEIVTALGQIAQGATGRDELVQLRYEVLSELRRMKKGESRLAMDEVELCEGAAGEEARIVRRFHDRLLLWLVEKEKLSSKRTILLAHDGYDLSPAAFYRQLLPEAELEGPDLAPDTEVVSRTLAAYSWIVGAVPPAEPKPLREGFKLGRFRGNFKPQAVPQEIYNELTGEWEYQILIHLLNLRYEEHRKPQRAEAYLELGQALHAQGKLERAEESLRQALHAFSGDPDTADRQAVAFIELGEVLEERAEAQQARYAYTLARWTDPDYALEKLGPSDELREPMTPLETLAETTGGRVVRTDQELASLLADLPSRVRLTYQVEEEVDGSLRPVEVRYRQQWRGLVHPAWTRLATPDLVAEARIRRLLSGDPSAGTLDVRVVQRPRAEGREIEARVQVSGSGLPTDPEERARFRVTVGLGGPEAEPVIVHEVVDPVALAGQATWTYRRGVDDSDDLPAVAVVVEDLRTGIWGGRLLDL